MHSSSPRGRDGRRPGRVNQQGQALIYGIFLLLISSLTLFLLFNTGQLSREKTKLVDTADAVAYSAGLLHARALNFDAYSNRAMIANEVAIAQLVSVGSWAKYVKAEGDSYDQCLPCAEIISMYGLDMFSDYPYSNASDAVDTAEELHSGAKEAADVSDKIVHNLLVNAQEVLYQGLVVARANLMQEVADANYKGLGPVLVDVLPIQSDLGSTGDTSVGSSDGPFIQKYEKDERTRFAEVVKIATYRDGFVKERNYGMVGTSPSCTDIYAGPHYDWITKRGGTEMIGFDEWKAMDTVSWWHWYLVTPKYAPPFCAISEVPVGYGAQPIYKDSDDDSFANMEYYSYSRMLNPMASLIADANVEEWKFSGLPSFYDLTESMLGKDDPRLKFAIRLTRKKGDTQTSEAKSSIKPTGRLDKFKGKQASDVLAALSASEVYFRRPDGEKLNSDANKKEIGSLFNPFWQVHLITPSSGNVDTAYGLQSAVAPK